MVSIIGKQNPFSSVTDKEDILTEQWLVMAKGASEIVGSMGKQFSMTRDDMVGNIKKIQDKFDKNKAKYEKFQDLMQDEIDNKEDKKDKSGTTGGLWLKRGLEYLCEVFFEVVAEHENSKLPGGKSDRSAIKIACQNAYETTLTKYHNFFIRKVVQAALIVSPYKETFMENMASGEKDKVDQVVDEMKTYEAALRAYIVVVGKLYQHFKYEDPCLDTAERKMEKSQQKCS